MTRHRVDPTPRGFVVEFEEEWVDEAGTPWYCREMVRADVGPEGIVDLAVYCTGDWDPRPDRRPRRGRRADPARLADASA